MDRLEALNREVIRMSRMAELWEELYGDKSIETVEWSEEMEKKYQEEVANMSDEEKCRQYGIPCSYGICSECGIAERS